MRSQSVLSTREIRVAVTTDTVPLAETVRFAFTAYVGRPTSGQWVTGAWKPTQLPTREWVAYVTVGPRGAAVLPVGEYAVWIDITDTSTEPVEPVATLTIV